MPDGVAHVPDLAVAAFPNRELDYAARAARGFEDPQQPDARRQGAAPLDLDAPPQPIEIAIVGHARNLCLVRALQFVPRMRHTLGELAVVGQQDEALGIGVETAHRIVVAGDAAARDQVGDRRAPLRIGSGAHDAAWLEHQEIPARGGCLEPASIDLHFVMFEICLGPQLGDDASVHFHSTLTQELIGRASRRDTGLGQELVQTCEHRKSTIGDRKSKGIDSSMYRCSSIARSPIIDCR